MEIERKYAINFFPGDLIQYENKKIEQGYLCNDPILRIRKSNNDYYLTYKSKIKTERTTDPVAIMNHEVELPLTEQAYTKLKLKTEGNIVYKTRYLIPIQGGLTAELDVFEEVLEGLVFVEVEFQDEAAANVFLPPDWFGKELSFDPRFSNFYLSTLSSYQELGLF